MELSREMMKGRNSKQQQQAVSGVLGSLMPPQAAERFRRWFPVSKVPSFGVSVCVRSIFLLTPHRTLGSGGVGV